MPQVTSRFGPYPLSTTVDGAGNAQVVFQPNGSHVKLTNIFARVSTQVAQATCTIYRGIPDANHIINVTQSGSTGAALSGTVFVQDGELLYIQWTGADVGAIATATLIGEVVPFSEVTASTDTRWDSPIAAGDGSLIYPALKSPNYVTGVSGWMVDRNGNVEFNQAVIRGSLTAGNGNVTVTSTGIRVYDPVSNRESIISTSGGFFARDVPDTGAKTQIFTSNFLTRPADPTPNGNAIDKSGLVNSFTYNPIGVVERLWLDLKSPSFVGGTQSEIIIESRSSTNLPGTINFNPDNSLQGTVKVGNFTDGFIDMGKGIMCVASSGVDSALVNAAETLVLTSGSYTFFAGRAYQITSFCRYSQGTAAAQTLSAAFRKTNLAGAAISNIGRFLQLPAATTTFSGYVEAVFTVGAADVTCAIAMTLTGSAANNAKQQGGRKFMIREIGPASDYPDDAVLS